MNVFAESHYLVLFLTMLMIVAFLYASVGHGGASGYLALMALFSFPVLVMKPSALLLNIFCGRNLLLFFLEKRAFQMEIILSLCDRLHPNGVSRRLSHHQSYYLQADSGRVFINRHLKNVERLWKT